MFNLKNEKLADDLFYSIEREVLKGWKTGEGVDFAEAVAYQKSQCNSRSFAKKLI